MIIALNLQVFVAIFRIHVARAVRASDSTVRCPTLGQVHPLPPSFQPYIWNWRSPSADDEERYALLLLHRRAHIAEDEICLFIDVTIRSIEGLWLSAAVVSTSETVSSFPGLF